VKDGGSRIGIILNGVTGRMGTNQHLLRSIKAIIDQGGVKLNDSEVIMPDPILVGRSASKLAALALRAGLPEERITTNLDAALADPNNKIYFDACLTGQRPVGVRKAIAAKKHIYCEKPTATTSKEALALYNEVSAAGLKNGVVQDKLWLPGLRKLALLKRQGFFGRILSVRGEFGYWVFTGEHEGQPAQRPSWNYRKGDGGGIIVVAKEKCEEVLPYTFSVRMNGREQHFVGEAGKLNKGDILLYTAGGVDNFAFAVVKNVDTKHKGARAWEGVRVITEAI